MSHVERLQKEIEWYRDSFRSDHPLNCYPLYSHLRNELSYVIARHNLAKRAKRVFPSANNVLIAPCGLGNDILQFSEVWPEANFHGLDISPDAVERCAIRDAKVGDILKMPYHAGSFDVVISTLFFHHVADEGFEPYLLEIARVLRPGGIVITMEQSSYHPLFLVTRPAKRIVGNITGQVEHEHPISISELAAAARSSGFARTETFSCSFGHNRMPIPITTVLNALNYFGPIKHFAWMVGLIAVKADYE
jgi:SAM-dependent methyltransferase